MPQRLDTVRLRPYQPDDYELLQALLGDAEMTRYLGGPESAEALAARHERYLNADPETNGLFAIVVGESETSAGWIGFWESEWGGELTWECGWQVLPSFQRRGVATRAVGLLLDAAATRRKHRFVDAFPSFDNVASNVLCQRAGFTDMGVVEVEYPKGHTMRSTHWRFDLQTPSLPQSPSATS